MRAVVRSVIVSAALLAGCVFGFRSEAEVEATYPLEDVLAVRVALPATPMAVIGDPEAVGLELRGEWRATGGNAEVAKANARTPRLVWEQSGSFAELRASVPLAVDGQVDLEIEELRLPPDRDLELRTELGDVSILGVESNLGVDVGTGDVDIVGGAGGIAVRTDLGDVVIETTGNTDGRHPDGAGRQRHRRPRGRRRAGLAGLRRRPRPRPDRPRDPGPDRHRVDDRRRALPAQRRRRVREGVARRRPWPGRSAHEGALNGVFAAREAPRRAHGLRASRTVC
jgi:hypothetical protein